MREAESEGGSEDCLKGEGDICLKRKGNVGRNGGMGRNVWGVGKVKELGIGGERAGGGGGLAFLAFWGGERS